MEWQGFSGHIFKPPFPVAQIQALFPIDFAGLFRLDQRYFFLQHLPDYRRGQQLLLSLQAQQVTAIGSVHQQLGLLPQGLYPTGGQGLGFGAGNEKGLPRTNC